MFDEEVVEQIEDTPVEQPAETYEEAPQEEAPAPKQKKDPSESFKELRERTARAERERDEMLRRIQELEAPHSHEPEEDLEVHIGADDLVEGKHLSKVGKKLKKMEQELQKYRSLAEQNSVEVQLKRKHADFDEVVSEANIKVLKEEHPEMFDVITASPDMYKKGLTAYKMIRQLGIAESAEFKEERETAQRNLAKPRPLVSGASQRGNTPLSQANAFANGLTPELKAQLRREMEEARSRS